MGRPCAHLVLRRLLAMTPSEGLASFEISLRRGLSEMPAVSASVLSYLTRSGSFINEELELVLFG